MPDATIHGAMDRRGTASPASAPRVAADRTPPLTAAESQQPHRARLDITSDRRQAMVASARRNRASANANRIVPMAASARNCGQTTPKPAPRYKIP